SLPHLVEHLAAELTERGGEVRTGLGACSLLVEDGRAVGIRDASGTEHRAEAVVVACGAGTSAVMAGAGVDIPDGSPLAMLVTTEPADAEAPVLNTPRAAMRPNPGGSFCVDHDWYVDQIVEQDDGTCTIDEAVVTELLAEASALLAGAPALRAATWACGRKPIPADGEPVLAAVGALPGCHVAFTHSGATLALVAGGLVTQHVITRIRRPLLEQFSPDHSCAGAGRRRRSEGASESAGRVLPRRCPVGRGILRRQGRRHVRLARTPAPAEERYGDP